MAPLNQSGSLDDQKQIAPTLEKAFTESTATEIKHSGQKCPPVPSKAGTHL